MLDLDSSEPLYQQLANLIRDKINKGEWKVGARIPSEAKLGEMYNISRITIRQALAALEKEGLVEKFPGKGTFVRNFKKVKSLTRLSSFSEVTSAAGMEASYKMIEIKRITYDEIEHIIPFSGVNEFLIVKRVLLASKTPVGMHTTYLPIWIMDEGTKDWFTPETLSHSSLHAAIEKAGFKMNRAEETVDPIRVGPQEVAHLGMDLKDVALQVKRMTYDVQDRPMMYDVDIYNPIHYTYRIEIFRDI